MNFQAQAHHDSIPYKLSRHEIESMIAYAWSMKQTLVAVILGICLWTIALVVEIARSAQSSTIWICVVGLALGLLGIADIARRNASARKKASLSPRFEQQYREEL